MDNLKDKCPDEQSRKLWSMRERFEKEIRDDVRNMLLLAGAIGAFGMPLVISDMPVLPRFVAGFGLVLLLLCVLIASIRMTFLLNVYSCRTRGFPRASTRYESLVPSILAYGPIFAT